METDPKQHPSKDRDQLERSLAPRWILRPSAHFGAAASSTAVAALPAPTSPRLPRRRGRSKQQVSERASVTSAWLGLAAAVALPVVAWHGTVADMAHKFSLSPGYLLTGWSGFALLAIALALLVPVALSVGPRPILGVRSRRALLSWGVVLYLLGLMLCSQVAALAG
jgi:hypothetical protein